MSISTEVGLHLQPGGHPPASRNTANGWCNAPELHAQDENGIQDADQPNYFTGLTDVILYVRTPVWWKFSTIPSSSARATSRLLGTLEERCKLGNLPCSAAGLQRPLGPACWCARVLCNIVLTIGRVETFSTALMLYEISYT